MNIEHLYYFIVIADNKSINKAAQKLFISQQHLSRVVIAFEKNLNTQLLERTSSGIELTKDGEIFLRYAEKIVTDYREMQSYFYLKSLPTLEHSEQIQGSCKISFPFFFSLFLNDFIRRINSNYPAVNLTCVENAYNDSAQELYQSPFLHLIINSTLSITEPNLVFYHIGDTAACFCVNKDSPLARKRALNKEDIAHELKTIYPAENSWRSNFDDTHTLFTSSNIYQHLDSVIHNHSICVVPAYIRAGIYAVYPDIILLPYEPMQLTPIYIVHSAKHVLNTAEKAVVRFTSQYIQKISVLDYYPNNSFEK